MAMLSNYCADERREADVVDRLRLLLKYKSLSKIKLAEATGITSERWGNILARKVAVRLEDILKVSESWPIYQHWLIFGEELPESGQISPMTEELAWKYLKDAENIHDDDFAKKTILKHVETLKWFLDINPGMKGNFVDRVNGLFRFYESGEFIQTYKDESLSALKRLSRMYEELTQKFQEKNITINDVKAIEWLDFLTRKGIERKVIRE